MFIIFVIYNNNDFCCTIKNFIFKNICNSSKNVSIKQKIEYFFKKFIYKKLYIQIFNIYFF